MGFTNVNFPSIISWNTICSTLYKIGKIVHGRNGPKCNVVITGCTIVSLVIASASKLIAYSIVTIVSSSVRIFTRLKYEFETIYTCDAPRICRALGYVRYISILIAIANISIAAETGNFCIMQLNAVVNAYRTRTRKGKSNKRNQAYLTCS